MKIAHRGDFLLDENMNTIAEELLRQVQSANSIAITTHVNPDGDGFCAALALQRILQTLGKQTTIITDDDDLSRYAFLREDALDLVATYSTELPVYELCIVLDCNSYDRIGARRAVVDASSYVILLDHHEVEHDPIQADLQYIEPKYVSVGAIIFDLLKPQILAMNSQDKLYVANSLYTTILNDTNNFANANTNSAVFATAAELGKLGIKPHLLYKEFFLNHSAEEMRYVGETLATIELHHDRRILTMFSSLEMMQRNNLNPDSVMNITRWVQGVQGLDAIVYFREDEPGLFKLSLRSVKLNVNEIAIRYGGGGHRQASGCTIKGKLEEIMAMLLKDLVQAVNAHYNPESGK